jgi:error-prone DNA polymerase
MRTHVPYTRRPTGIFLCAGQHVGPRPGRCPDPGDAVGGVRVFAPRQTASTAPPFSHLHVHGPFSRLDAASGTEALCARAAALGMDALALTDHDTLSGAVPFLQACGRYGLHPVLGAEVTLVGGHHLTLLCPDAAGYAALCRLLTAAHLGNPRDHPAVAPEELARAAPHLIALSGCRQGEVAAAILAGDRTGALRAASAMAALFGPGRFFLELPADRLPAQQRLVRHLRELGERLGLQTVATADVHYAEKGSAWVADLLTCVRLRCRLEDLPPERAVATFNAERYLKSAAEVAAAVGDPGACARAHELAWRCQVPLQLGISRTPRFPLPDSAAPAVALRRQVEAGARWRYGAEVAPALWRRLEHELAIIERLGFADYFLCVADVARWARAQGIRTAGRGSAADSAVAYVLGITDVDAAGRGHLFERFLSEERAEAPDIDLDFDARGRDRVAAYVVERYGQERVAAVAAHNTFGARAAVREIGRVLGFPPAELDRVSRRIPYDVPAADLPAALQAVPELAALPGPRARLVALAEAVAAVAGLPRHLATHLGGLCVAPGAITELMPVQRSAKGVVVAQFDKRDLEALGLLKLDLLSLRTLGAVDDALRIRAHQGEPLDYAAIPPDDGPTFARLRRGETVGVFQLESAAQMALQERLGASELEDVIASVALIRPGPIKGNMVDPFVRRRRGQEPVTYPHPGLEAVLRRTYGVVVYQEQVIAIATEVAGFTPGEADRLRRVMSHARSPKDMEELGALFRARAQARGVAPQVAADIFHCLQGYASYGFPEAHAVAFGVTAYRTAYLAQHHPAAYFAGLLANQPMGFYPVRTLVNELRRRGVAVLPPDVHTSGVRWGEGEDDSPRCLRAPLQAIAGMRAAVAAAVVAERRRGGPYTSLFDLCRRVPSLPRDTLDALVLSGACDGLGEAHGTGAGGANRRQLLWSLPAVSRAARAGGMALPPPSARDPGGLTDFTEREKWLQEERLLGFSPRGHVMQLVRAERDLEARGDLCTGQARAAPDGTRLSVAGVPVRPHRPPTRSGRRLVFLALEDEEGLLGVMVPEDVYRRDAAVLFPAAPVLEVTGRIRRRGAGAVLVAARVRALL